MLKTSSYLALAVAVALPGVATAQTASTNAGDIAYCKALAARYMAMHPGTMLPTGAVGAAVSRCDTDPVDSIKTLEPKLQGAGVALPSREQTGRQQ
jgi:hypothetical protein